GRRRASSPLPPPDLPRAPFRLRAAGPKSAFPPPVMRQGGPKDRTNAREEDPESCGTRSPPGGWPLHRHRQPEAARRGAPDSPRHRLGGDRILGGAAQKTPPAPLRPPSPPRSPSNHGSPRRATRATRECPSP